MERYIVRVKSVIDENKTEYGTGLFVSNDLVICPSHIVIGEKHYVIIDDKCIIATILSEAESFSLLRINEKVPYFASDFSDDEVLDTDSLWNIHGFITEIQEPHEITGKGIHISDTCSESAKWNGILQSIMSGKKNTYKGLSGSPVYSNNRIVGILQCEEIIDGEATELKMATVDRFKTLLPSDVIAPNEYKSKLSKMINDYTKEQIEHNKKYRKYIPDIYVEEFDYKEKVRYFADPVLFFRKTVCELLKYDFSAVNSILRGNNSSIIDFKNCESFSKADFCYEDVTQLYSLITKAINSIKEAESSKSDYNYINEISYRRTVNNNRLKGKLEEQLELLKMIPIKYLVLCKEAGQGKTNFLCDFTENFLLKKGYRALYFNAKDFSDELINLTSQFLTIHSEYDLNYAKKVLTKEYEKRKKPFIIVIDGLNENSSLDDFGCSVKRFLEKCEEFPFVKVLMTTRTEFYEERFGVLTTGIYQGKFSSIHMEKADRKFKTRILEGYFKYFNIKIREGTFFSATYKKLTSNYLLLRFFCEVNANKKDIPMYDVFIYEVFEKYTVEKYSKYSKSSSGVQNNTVEKILNNIISNMIETQEYNTVSTAIFTENEFDLLNEMLDNEVVFKGESSIKAGLVFRKVETIGFTFDEYRDFCITNYVITHYDEERLLCFMNQISESQSPICEGLQKYLFYLSYTKYRLELKGIIKRISVYEEIYWNHIWSIDEKYIDQEDVKKCKEHIMNNTEYMQCVVENMVLRFDCNYYKKININLLMGIFDEMLLSSNGLFDIIVSLFPNEKDDMYYGLEPKIKCINTIISYLKEGISKTFPVEQYIELLRFTVYLFQNDKNDICELWEYFYGHNKAGAYKILGDMNVHSSSLIQMNTSYIISYILRKHKCRKLQDLLESNNYHMKERTRLRDNMHTICFWVDNDESD